MALSAALLLASQLLLPCALSAPPAVVAPAPAAVSKVHVLFSHHLDVGLDIQLKLTEDCVGFDIRARQVNIALRNEVALPGSTVVVDGLLSHPWTGAPMNAPRVEWLASYIIEEDGVQEFRDQRSALVEVTGTFDFFWCRDRDFLTN